jgi:peptide/nickel transport system permease protein
MHIDLKREVTRSTSGRFGIGLFGLILASALFAPLLAGYDPLAQSVASFQPPSMGHLLGTNHVGQDIWSQLVYGARTSLMVGFSVAFIATTLSALLGAASALIGGLFDRILMRVVDAFIVIPILIIMVLLAAYLKPSLWVLIIMLSLLSWQSGARTVRAQSLSLKSRMHVSAARCFGAGRWYLIRRHILPDLSPILVVGFIYSLRRAIFMEAGLAFIGIADPGTVSWGMMMKKALDFSYLDAWTWWLIPAGVALSLTIIAITFIGHSMEPAMDPRLREEVEGEAIA